MAETRTPDLFDRLLARTGAASRPDAVVPLARPRLAMPFERLPAAAPTETEVEIDAAAPARPETFPVPRPTAQAAPQGAPAPPASVLSRIERTVRSIETVRTLSAESPRAAQPAAPPVLHSDVERLVPAAEAVARAVEQPVDRRPAADMPAPTPSVRTAPAARTGSAALRSVPRSAGEVRRREPQTAPAEPSVQVTIGRLEVTTAPHEPKRERNGRTGRPQPAVGLDAFLDRREAT
ncbi:hypothetical protein ABZ464_16270 [Streptomyces sp. NPDC005820]|uniref:hypothetical protein n=1 Tax=Streptomyces sp. NPDC005820 TaxID=3157069 RepID=UPI00340C5273